MKSFFYHGDSMKRVFRPGDEVFVRPVAARECRAGAIVVFAGAAGERVIHRVIEASPDGLRTMGDNNASPDAGVRREGEELFLALSFRRKGREFRLARGAAGMREFRRHRSRRRLRHFGGGWLRRIPRCFARLRLPLLEATGAHRFGEVVHRTWLGRTVARCYPDGRIRYTHWYWRLVFAPPDDENTRRP